MTPEKNLEQVNMYDGWIRRLQSVANEMDDHHVISVQCLSDHVDSIVDELEFQRNAILEDGPIVMFRNGTCVVHSATDR